MDDKGKDLSNNDGIARPPQEVTRESLLEAWLTVRKIAGERAAADWACAISDLKEEIAGEHRVRLAAEEQAAEFARHFRDLLTSIVGDGAQYDPAPLRDTVRLLDGPISGEDRPIRLPVVDLAEFTLIGRLADSHGRIPPEKSALFSFKFLDDSGAVLEAAGSMPHSSTFGDYRYLRPDPNGWFHADVFLPTGTAVVEVSAHDFRKFRKMASGPSSGTLLLSRLDVVARQISLRAINSALFDAPERARRATMPVIIREGCTGLLKFDPPVRSTTIEITLAAASPAGGGIEVMLDPLVDSTTGTGRPTIHEQGQDPTKLRLSAEADTPFAHALLRLRAVDRSRPLILLSNSVDQVAASPMPGVVANFVGGTVPVRTLNIMADDWDARSRWYGVNKDPTLSDGPLVLVQRVSADAAPQAFTFTYSGLPGSEEAQKGMVLSCFLFDADGRRMELGSTEFRSSAKVGDYKYVSVTSRVQTSFSLLPTVRGASFLALSLQSWGGAQVGHVSPQPKVGDARLMSEKMLEDLVSSDRLLDSSSHGVFAHFGGDRWRALFPNAWRRLLGQSPTAVLVRAGKDRELSPWRDLADTLWSPDTKPLREIVARARSAGWPILLDIKDLPEDEALPVHLIRAADEVIAAEHQIAVVSNIARPSAVISTRAIS